jgi:hypothetical protein
MLGASVARAARGAGERTRHRRKADGIIVYMQRRRTTEEGKGEDGKQGRRTRKGRLGVV